MISGRKVFFCMLALLSITASIGCASASAAVAGKVNKPAWTMDIPPSAAQWEAESSRARIVIFRLQKENDDYALLPLNVFVNKDYHASLYPEHQAVSVSVCPGVSSLIVFPGNRKSGMVGYGHAPDVATPVLHAGSTYFYQIAMDDMGQVAGRWVNADQAKEVLSSVNIQAHTLSRVDSGENCPSESYILNSSVLFKFDKYDTAGLLPGAVQTINELAAAIKSGHQNISKIVVIGHADPLGSARHNQFISEQRARTVMNHLISAGLDAQTLSAQGLGSSTPVRTDCDKYSSQRELINCNQPNRRVEVEVYGIKKPANQ
ncbi:MULTISPECIES: OmpA family protein [Tenebrionibacter/Tenebrionicola group]|jgi:OOP family OmpA-OmpF porin|uniref:OmpA family protein n=2 Tax=Tenebrionibacter/Tenebrionicola group TaxID=2969848 RepID=A0A8K0V390_9ENTR|nr:MULTISPECIES: OmpA family protein [Tenebrionibacter/Tenebrionicola group]MBK4716273.1 OmpA family protein [Tenebrionibacter intestinalis]MBV4412156.1 OmpA family protein [Tenebrionicola larvae]MBV5097116.1 OmpA family protein [Tenebrionicola larvae]